MKVFCRQEGKSITLALKGDLDHHAARDALREIGVAVDTRLPARCVLDMEGVDFMDSSGLAVVLGTYRRMSEIGGALTVTHVPRQAARVFSAAGLNKIIHME